MQKICVVYAVLPGNHLKIWKMIPFGLRAQEKPAKCKSTAACKQSATGKCMTDVWTFTTKTLTPEEKLEQRIKIWKKLNEMRSSNRMWCYHQIQKKILKKVIQEKSNNWKFYSDLWNLLIPFVSWNISITSPSFPFMIQPSLIYLVRIFLFKVFNIRSNYSCYNSIIIYIFTSKEKKIEWTKCDY